MIYFIDAVHYLKYLRMNYGMFSICLAVRQCMATGSRLFVNNTPPHLRLHPTKQRSLDAYRIWAGCRMKYPFGGIAPLRDAYETQNPNRIMPTMERRDVIESMRLGRAISRHRFMPLVNSKTKKPPIHHAQFRSKYVEPELHSALLKEVVPLTGMR